MRRSKSARGGGVEERRFYPGCQLLLVRALSVCCKIMRANGGR